MPELTINGVVDPNVLTYQITFTNAANVATSNAVLTNVTTTNLWTDSVVPFTTHTQYAAYGESAEAAAEEREAALAAAKKLLLEYLDETQREEYGRENYFHVQTADGERCYRIYHGISGNIVLVKDGKDGEDGSKVGTEYCIHPYGSFPTEDTMLTQKLLIETDEQEFLRIANASAPF